MRRDKQVLRAALTLAVQGRAEPFQSIELVAVGRDRAQGRTPGLYRCDAQRPAVGLLVYDPTHGDPVVPNGRLAPWGLVIECHVADEES